jgi:hypothetical protein
VCVYGWEAGQDNLALPLPKVLSLISLDLENREFFSLVLLSGGEFSES